MTRLLEHQGKSLLRNVGIRVPAGDVATTPHGAKEIAEKIKKPVAIKAQVSATGRFKAGGIGFATSPDEAQRIAERILGSTIKGFVVQKVLVEEKLGVEKEFYASVIVDDSYKVKAPVLMASTRCGVDIEQIALQHPE